MSNPQRQSHTADSVRAIAKLEIEAYLERAGTAWMTQVDQKIAGSRVTNSFHVGDETPAAIQTSTEADEGDSLNLARADHIHPITFGSGSYLTYSYSSGSFTHSFDWRGFGTKVAGVAGSVLPILSLPTSGYLYGVENGNDFEAGWTGSTVKKNGTEQGYAQILNFVNFSTVTTSGGQTDVYAPDAVVASGTGEMMSRMVWRCTDTQNTPLPLSLLNLTTSGSTYYFPNIVTLQKLWVQANVGEARRLIVGVYKNTTGSGDKVFEIDYTSPADFTRAALEDITPGTPGIEVFQTTDIPIVTLNCENTTEIDDITVMLEYKEEVPSLGIQSAQKSGSGPYRGNVYFKDTDTVTWDHTQADGEASNIFSANAVISSGGQQDYFPIFSGTGLTGSRMRQDGDYIIFTPSESGSYFYSDANVGHSANFVFSTETNRRWVLEKTSGVEAGSAGSDFRINRRSGIGTGSNLGNPLYIYRDTGRVVLQEAVSYAAGLSFGTNERHRIFQTGSSTYERITIQGAEDTKLEINAPTGYLAQLDFSKDDIRRWTFGATSGTEVDFRLQRRDDAGDLLGDIFYVNRSTGAIRFSEAISAAAAIRFGDDDTNLYRSAADSLQSDDVFSSIGLIVGAPVGTSMLAQTGLWILGDGGARTIVAQRHENSANSPVWQSRKTRGSYASPTSVQNGDDLGAFSFFGYQSSDYRQAAAIFAGVDAAPSGTAVQGNLQFWTTNASGTSTLAGKIDSAQKWWIGSTADTNLYRSAANVLKTDDGFQAVLGFGCNSKTPQTAYSVNAASSDLVTVVALCNQLRAALVANGICV